jgi:hypothetical protein
MLEEVRAEGLDEGGGVVGDIAGSDFGVESRRNVAPAPLLQDGNDLGGLQPLAKELYVEDRLSHTLK